MGGTTRQVWVGYRTHLTESCDPDAEIHVITQVETVLAPTQDVEVVETIHADLAEQGSETQAALRRCGLPLRRSHRVNDV